MAIQSIRNIEGLAKVSRVLGIISFIFLLLASIIGLWIRLSDYDEFRKLALFAWVIYAFIGNLITGIPGFIVAIIALRRNKTADDDPNIKQVAKLGLLLSIMGTVVAVIVFISTLICSSINPPPPSVTPPIPSTAVP